MVAIRSVLLTASLLAVSSGGVLMHNGNSQQSGVLEPIQLQEFRGGCTVDTTRSCNVSDQACSGCTPIAGSGGASGGFLPQCDERTKIDAENGYAKCVGGYSYGSMSCTNDPQVICAITYTCREECVDADPGPYYAWECVTGHIPIPEPSYATPSHASGGTCPPPG